MHIFVELCRIKKPSKIALVTGRLICLLVNLMRERPYDLDFSEWAHIKAFIEHNVNRFTQEVQSIKKRVIVIEGEQAMNFSSDQLTAFELLRQAYFPDEASY